ncbi:MAG: DinB family protein [Anaerolineaceae bacterium]|nr:DinB family protein [Anaerolineaceae bacterium]
MNTQDIQTLFDYNYWATRRILTAAAQVSLEQFITHTGHGLGSLRGTLVHTLDGERAWRKLFEEQTLAYFGAWQEADFATFDLLVQQWQADEQAMRTYLAQLSDDALNGIISYTTPEGAYRERVLWHCLLHLANHGTQHRSEAAAILTGYGRSPGDLDFTAFLNEQ